MDKSGKAEGAKTVLMWVLVIGIIALILLIMAILFGNLSGNIGFGQDSASYYNETITLNASATPASAKGKINGALSSIIMTNATDGLTVHADNYTTDGVRIISIGTNDVDYNLTSVNVSYTVAYDEEGKIDTDNIIFNYTDSAVNVAKQLPTTGTILGVAILLAVLIFILVFAIKRMMGVTSGAGGIGGGGGGGGSSRFRGSSNSEFG